MKDYCCVRGGRFVSFDLEFPYLYIARYMRNPNLISVNRERIKDDTISMHVVTD